MVHAGDRRSIPWIDRVVVDLGPRTSGTLLHDFHATAVAQLAGERRVYHRGIFSGARAALCREHTRTDFSAELVDDCGNSALPAQRGLHGVFVRPGEGPRPLAESTVAAALGCASAGSRSARAGAVCRPMDKSRTANIAGVSAHARDYSSAVDHHGRYRRAPAHDLRRSIVDPWT